jgi:hypothetical protein
VIAVVDGHADRRVVIGAAAAAGESGGLMHQDTATLPGELYRRGQTGETRANDMNGAVHYSMIPKSGCRFPACAKPRQGSTIRLNASAGEARSEKIMLKQCSNST